MGDVYEKRLKLPVSAAEAFQWHARPGALDRLIPPWEDVVVADAGNGIVDGSIVELRPKVGPVRMRWIAKHHGYEANRRFCDTQIAGPFARWEHEHRFSDSGDRHAELCDHVEYELPAGALGRFFGNRAVRSKLRSMFQYRHVTTHDDLRAHAKHKDRGSLRVAVTGGNGLLGAVLTPLLTTGGHQVTRAAHKVGAKGEIKWELESDSFRSATFSRIDAVIHLAGHLTRGASGGSRPSQSRNDSEKMSACETAALCDGLASMAAPPKTLLCISSIGYYGDGGAEWRSEGAPAGRGPLCAAAGELESATQRAAGAGIRVVLLRLGVPLSPKGGALAAVLRPFRLCLGGRVGRGDQFWSWISIDDAVGAIHHALMTPEISGAVNLVAPNPVQSAEFANVLGNVLRRPAAIPISGLFLRAALGPGGRDLLTSSVRAEPGELLRSGYEFRQPTLEVALRHLLGRAA